MNLSGKLVQCKVINFAYKRPEREQLEEAHPVRDEETSLWVCPYCKKNDFPELSLVSCSLFRGVKPFAPCRAVKNKRWLVIHDLSQLMSLCLHSKVTRAGYHCGLG